MAGERALNAGEKVRSMARAASAPRRVVMALAQLATVATLATLTAMVLCVLFAACGKREPERVDKPQVHTPVGEQRRVRHILVLYRGAQGAGPEVTRSKAAADSLLKSLRQRVERGESFASLAREFSDDPSRAEGGQIDVLRPGDTPPDFERVAMGLAQGEMSPVFESPLGMHLIQRIDGPLIGAEHILVRFRGCVGAPDSLTRSRTEALAIAETLLAEVRNPQVAFGVAAAHYSEDPLSAPRGGYVGEFARGSMVKPFEDAAYALAEGEISDIVESPFGFHIIKRVSLERIRVQHILVTHALSDGLEVGTRTEEEALRRALDVLFRARKGESFDDLAREYSEDRLTASKGGTLPPLSRGQAVPEFEEVAFTLPVGQVSDVVRTHFGFHIIKRLQ
jgi:peptidyl-prolyl cis-trans isomerase SurA